MIELEKLKTDFDKSFSEPPIDQKTESVKILCFRLENDPFGIPIEYVREILTKHHISRVPGAPDFIKGVMNLHGEIISVSVIHSIFKLVLPRAWSALPVIVLKNLPFDTSILVNSIIGIIDVEKDHLHSPSVLQNAEISELISSGFKYLDEMVMIPDMVKLGNSKYLQID